MSGILYRKNGGSWQAPKDSGYLNEDQLQAVIHDFPQLLPGVEPNSYACREFNTKSGPIDNLIINSKNGAITLVECKLAKNQEVRRKIIGQIIDYAASLSKMNFQEFHTQWQARGGANLASIKIEESSLSQRIEENLEAARFTLLVTVDEINDPLKDMVVYFNNKTDSTTRVALIELGRHLIDGSEIIIPRTFGYEALKPDIDEYDNRAPWSFVDYSAWLNSNEPKTVDIFEGVIKKFEQAGFNWSGTKAETPSGAIKVMSGGQPRFPLVFHTFGKATVEVRFQDFKKEVFVEELGEIFTDIDEINIAAIKDRGFSAKPKIDVFRLSDPKILEALIALCKRIYRG